MGYMGFGMVKRVYQRRPKKVFGKIKSVYGKEYPKYCHKNNLTPETLSEEDKLRIKQLVKKNIIRINTKRTVISVFILAFCLAALYLVTNFFVQKIAQYKVEYYDGKKTYDVIFNEGEYSKIERFYNQDGNLSKAKYYKNDSLVKTNSFN